MINLLDLTNASDKGAIAETNFQRIDASLAFGATPSLDLTGNPTALIGPPAAGTFLLGQFWVDSLLAVWRCTIAGTPGTWIQHTPAIVQADPAGAPANYFTLRSDLHWTRRYFDGAAWQNCP
jgi:hypothetical protein